jgi:hypothetical protein
MQGPITSEPRAGDSRKVLKALQGLAEQEARRADLKANADHYKKLNRAEFNKRMRMEERHGSPERKKGTVQPKQASGKVATGYMARAAIEDSDLESRPDSAPDPLSSSSIFDKNSQQLNEDDEEDEEILISYEDDEEILELLNESDDELEDIPLQERKYNPNHNAEKIHLGGVKTLYYLDDEMHICQLL